jgi:hypothetical protein
VASAEAGAMATMPSDKMPSANKTPFFFITVPFLNH